MSLDDAQRAVREGADAFRRCNVEQSLERFDRVYSEFPSIRPYLWQRGISLYYGGRFREASDQFRLDVQVNPYDVEEVVWDIASELRLEPGVFPPRNMMSVPSLSRDRRRIMVSGESASCELRDHCQWTRRSTELDDGTPVHCSLSCIALFSSACRLQALSRRRF
jgi:hypothetical protein